jgi:hypothetical protein
MADGARICVSTATLTCKPEANGFATTGRKRPGESGLANPVKTISTLHRKI